MVIAMNKKRVGDTIELPVDGQMVQFDSVKEFEYALSSKTTLPAQKMASLKKMAPRELKVEAGTIAELEKHFENLLANLEDVTINQVMMRLDPSIFSQDHGWRGIISGLNACGSEHRDYKLAALNKYMEYLRSRKSLLQDLYDAKMAEMAEGGEAGHDRTRFVQDKLSATASLNSTMSGTASEAMHKMKTPRHDEPVTRRLPKGEPVIITLPSGDDLDLSLSKHKFRLFWRQGLVLVDKEGNNYLLGLGKNVIGRDVDCEVSLNPSMKDISRKHLIIENLGNNRLKLTDLSSHGTTVTQ